MTSIRNGERDFAALMLSLVAVLALSGCSFWAPVQTSRPYVPADGLPLSTPSVQFENLVIVAPAAGHLGVLTGQAINTTPHPVEVSVTVPEGKTSANFTLPPGAADGIKSRRSPLSLGPISQPPGALAHLEVTLDPGGTHLVDVPVLPPDDGLGYYRGITPSIPAGPHRSATTNPPAREALAKREERAPRRTID